MKLDRAVAGELRGQFMDWGISPWVRWWEGLHQERSGLAPEEWGQLQTRGLNPGKTIGSLWEGENHKLGHAPTFLHPGPLGPGRA